MASNNAIVCLTRGYSDIKKYNDLIMRNIAIWKHINQDFKYPLVIFHEGNITKEHQDYINSKSMGQNIIFTDISSVWRGGYEGMCRFQTYELWKLCSEYKAVLRIDEDCVIQKIIYDPFDQLFNSGLPYMTSVFWAESHSETNATLPGFLEKLTGAKALNFYNNKFPYTNVSICLVDYWLKKENILKAIVDSPLQRANRWGDLPVLGSLLNIYENGKIGTMAGLSYYHSSHNVSINCE
jgi:hypothetical protein